MLRYKTKTRPGLVALYDIRPGNGAGPFLQPRSPHGANGKDPQAKPIDILNHGHPRMVTGTLNICQNKNHDPKLNLPHDRESTQSVIQPAMREQTSMM